MTYLLSRGGANVIDHLAGSTGTNQPVDAMQSFMNAKVKSLKVTLGSRELEFTIEEAEALLDVLREKLGKPTPIIIERDVPRHSPQRDAPQPIYQHPPRYDPLPSRPGRLPEITCHARPRGGGRRESRRA